MKKKLMVTIAVLGALSLISQFGFDKGETPTRPAQKPSQPSASMVPKSAVVSAGVSHGNSNNNEKKAYSVAEAIQKLDKEMPKAFQNSAVANTEPPKKRLIKDEDGAEIIELTYQNGGKLYMPNIAAFDPLENRYTPPLAE